MECPRCGESCLRAAKEVLDSLDQLYMACPNCPPEPAMKKDLPFFELQGDIHRCNSCGRAPLDLVMWEALETLVDMGLRDASDTLQSVGSPLIEIGCPLAYPPRLDRNNLIIVGQNFGKRAAQRLVEIPEIKGVIESTGGVPGVIDSEAEPHSWTLLEGCDLRGDVVQSLFGDILIYKSQSQVHIEFSRQNAPKMKILEDLYFKRKVSGSVVADVLCGPGTLGLMCVLAGAKKVILNDIWLPAVENVMHNLEANKSLLKIVDIERLEIPSSNLGKEPILVGRAAGDCEIEVYHGNIKHLFTKVKATDICLIDPFPKTKIKPLTKACQCCKEMIIV